MASAAERKRVYQHRLIAVTLTRSLLNAMLSYRLFIWRRHLQLWQVTVDAARTLLTTCTDVPENDTLPTDRDRRWGAIFLKVDVSAKAADRTKFQLACWPPFSLSAQSRRLAADIPVSCKSGGLLFVIRIPYNPFGQLQSVGACTTLPIRSHDPIA